MTSVDLINLLTVLVLLGLLVASIYLIIVLYRANRVLSRIDGLSETFRSFVSQVVPAIINVGTIASAVESILRTLSHHHDSKTKRPRSKE